MNPEPSPNPIVRLLTSSKALVVLAVTAACFGALFTSKADWAQVTEFLKWVLGPWLVAQGAEDAAKHFANRPTTPMTINTGTTVPPPPGPVLPVVVVDATEEKK